jgi:hypothetical protein
LALRGAPLGMGTGRGPSEEGEAGQQCGGHGGRGGLFLRLRHDRVRNLRADGCQLHLNYWSIQPSLCTPIVQDRHSILDNRISVGAIADLDLQPTLALEIPLDLAAFLEDAGHVLTALPLKRRCLWDEGEALAAVDHGEAA